VPETVQPQARFLARTALALAIVSPLAAGQAAEDAFAAADMQQLANRYCLACHNDGLATAGLSLQSVDFNQPGRHAAVLEEVVRKLRAHMMPPAGMPRPPFETYERMTHWLETALDAAWAADPDPGRVTPLQRMNRYEYNNTVNDLLGIDVDVMDLLPGDPTADGSFDNIAASLPFTTAHMERYMSVARQLTRLATGLPPDGPTIQTYEIPLYASQDWRQSEDMPFGSRGGVAVDHYFPIDGVYRLRVALETNYQDYIKGLGWAQQLEIRLDGRLLERFGIGGEAPGTPAPLSFSGTGEPGSIDWEQYMLFEAGAGLEVEVPVTAGAHTVTASYVRQQVQEEGIPQPRQGGRLPANDEAYLAYQKVHALEIGGPYTITGNANDSPSRRAIFTCYPAQRAAEAACAEEILSRLARRAYRRGVTDADTALLLNFFRTGREQGGSFDAGIQFALEYLLSDPEFLIRSYRQPANAASGETWRLSDVELASRLSYFLWSSAPDAELLDLAEQGRLSDPPVYRQQVRRLLGDRRGVNTLVEDFAAQWLNLRRLDEVNINTVLFPEYDVSLMEAFERETELFVADTLRRDSSVMDLIGPPLRHRRRLRQPLPPRNPAGHEPARRPAGPWCPAHRHLLSRAHLACAARQVAAGQHAGHAAATAAPERAHPGRGERRRRARFHPRAPGPAPRRPGVRLLSRGHRPPGFRAGELRRDRRLAGVR